MKDISKERDSLAYEDLSDKGIDTSQIAVCKKIRQLAKLDRISLDETEHRSGLNKHLFDYIEYCGLNVLDFIKMYLSNLQPYMIERRKDQEKRKSFICVLDNLYRISVYIKLDSTQFEEVIVSFHEDNKRGVAKSNDIIKVMPSRYVPIFADSVCSHMDEKYVVKVFIQRGLKVFPIEIAAMKCKDVFIVERNGIDQLLLSYCNEYIRDLYTSDLNIDFNQIDVFTMLQQISFTSYGNDVFSSISLLVDSLCAQHDQFSKAVADSALITFVQSLKLTKEQADELKLLLDKKYTVTSIKGIDLILYRVKENLAITLND
jgi:hypothetical protein